MIFPTPDDAAPHTTRLILDEASEPGRLPIVRWVGVADDSRASGPDPLALLTGRGSPMVVEQSRGAYERPGLRGHRVVSTTGGARDIGGRGWTTAFRPAQITTLGTTLVIDAEDADAGLALRTDIETLPGGALRCRHTLTNLAPDPFLLDGLEVSLPLSAQSAEILDFTGRHEGERTPQRHQMVDGLWIRESRKGKPGLDGSGVVIAGTAGFGFAHGELLSVSVAHSGNSTIAVERSGAAGPIVSAGELLLPGEVVLPHGETYRTPWVVFAASVAGLDSAARSLHTWQRSLPAHPKRQPITLNVWEAVYFAHEPSKLTGLAELAARIGVERFVLDDGWFHGRRDDTAGLGDWWVDPDVWPAGLGALADTVHRLGMEFGLWFEPEMVNPDSDLYRAHPDWILAPVRRVPLLHRHQQVLDLTNRQAWEQIRDQVSAVLGKNRIDYVKWDHNRDLLEAGSALHGGAPAAHAQTEAFYALLDDLRARHPGVAWESCAGGGGRIDLGVVERVQRFWTSDGTDALTRQSIQRWTAQYIAPEYLGAHISAPTSHQTGRTLPLDFRAATAFFLAFGIEWDLTTATESDLETLTRWCALHRRLRPLLHAGTTLRFDTADPAVLAHGVVADDASEAVICVLQLDESVHNRGTTLCIPGLAEHAAYDIEWLLPVDPRAVSMSMPLPLPGPTAGRPVTGAQLARLGLWLPRRRPYSALLMHVTHRVQ